MNGYTIFSEDRDLRKSVSGDTYMRLMLGRMNDANRKFEEKTGSSGRPEKKLNNPLDHGGVFFKGTVKRPTGQNQEMERNRMRRMRT